MPPHRSNRHCLYRRIFLLAPRHNVQHPIRQRPLKLQRLDRLASQPEVELLSCGQDHRHRFRMDGRDDGVRFRGRQKPEQLMLALDRRALGAAYAPPAGPQSREGEQRPLFG